MKLKQVDLYVDLYPDWHTGERPWVYGSSNPTDKPPETAIRVKVSVNLPEHPKDYGYTMIATPTSVRVVEEGGGK